MFVGRFTGTLQLGDKSITASAGTTDGVLARIAGDGSVGALRALGPAYFASYDAAGNHRWSKALRGNSVGYLHGKHQVVVLQHEAPSSTNPDSSQKWLVFDEGGTLQRERTIATGQLLYIYTEFRLSSMNGRLYAGGRIEGSATLFGTPLTATKDDAFAFSQEP
ncbi:hypothetical protein LVJ94_09530 [Pendulispora rubella]|uniref:Uncharacterized protein n=1 Tax=Pendulispora rubella TaxID=2741070 RepID=A0ABZ2L969_9BACT